MDDTLIFYASLWGGLLVAWLVFRCIDLKQDVRQLKSDLRELRSETRSELRQEARMLRAEFRHTRV